MGDEEEPESTIYEFFHKVCRWVRRKEACNSDNIRELMGTQKAIAKIYVELPWKTQANNISFSFFKNNIVIAENLSSTETIRRK